MATSPLINWPRLFHAVVGLWCWHIRWLGEKIFMELGHKPERRQGRGRGMGTGSPRERKAGEVFFFSMAKLSNKSLISLTAQDESFVTWQTALIQESCKQIIHQKKKKINRRKTSWIAFTQFTLDCGFSGFLSITLYKFQTHDLCTKPIPQRQSPIIRLYSTTGEPIAVTQPQNMRTPDLQSKRERDRKNPPPPLPPI